MHLLTLLFVVRVSAEWVEISQHHYRKPIRPHNPFTTPKTISVQDTTKPWSYNNRSVTEYNWNKSPSKTPNVGSIKRVQLSGSTVRTTEIIQLHGEDIDFDVDTLDLKHHHRKSSPTETPQAFNVNSKQKGTIERVPHIGNIKRVQLNESPVKAQSIILKEDEEKDSTKIAHHIGDPLQNTATNFEDKKNLETFTRRIYVNKRKKDNITERPVTFPPENGAMFVTDEETDLKQVYRNYSSTIIRSPKPTFITETEDFNSYGINENWFFRIKDGDDGVTENTFLRTTEGVHINEDVTLHTATKKPTKITSKPTGFQNSNRFATSTDTSHENNVHLANKEKYEQYLEYHTEKPKQPENRTERNSSKPEKAYQGKAANGMKTDNSTKLNTIENVLKFMTVVADTISKNSRRSFGGKISYLQNLKDSILANIEDHVEATWPDEDSAGTRRHSRSAQASPRGHVHVPSSESALMTISFLTFAVFLIKLVLQVIHTYKNKAMMVAPLVVAAAGRNMFSRHVHH